MLCGGATLVLLLGGLIALAVVLLTRTSSGREPSGGSTASTSPTPMEILKARYARGEITKEEYTEMREHLRTD
jgi:uncharacterized membrane protein